MSTFFNKPFAVAEQQKITPEKAIERMAQIGEHPFVAARHYVKHFGVEWAAGFLQPANRRALDKARTAPYRWEQGITSTDVGKALFVVLYRPGFLSHEQIEDKLGALAQVAKDFAASATQDEIMAALEIPTMAALYKVASIVRSEEQYADLPRRRALSLSAHQRAVLDSLLVDRTPYANIAKEFGVSVNTLREYLRENGVAHEPRRPGRRSDDSRNAAIVADYAAGQHPVKISERYGLTPARVYQIIRDNATPETIYGFKASVKKLFTSYPTVPEEVELAIHTLLAWTEED